ncbi:MAG: tRNA 2-thiouridine(34) synthase MnmA [Gammaproteobacteria bacterium]|nr:tRNA 2-thiouridine(34) synthase MnmA [Gammaproteobacteria bacterium]
MSACARERVVVALSGGVDSSVAALLLARAGNPLEALFMKNWNEPLADGSCRWESDVADALAVCERIGIDLDTVDLSRQYWDDVFAHCLHEYAHGRTPNPDVLCNREVKFDAFLAAARRRGADRIATGHYARRDRCADRWRLLRGRDLAKDQSYFLYTLGQAQLEATLFPIGELDKRAVRSLAREAGLATHAKKDSTGICFIGEQRFRDFLARFLPTRPGEIRSLDERVIGTHPGAAYFTLGQREGLGIGGVRGAAEAPWFVVDKDVDANVLYVVQGHDHPALMSTRLVAGQLSWVSGLTPAAPLRCTAKTRYRQADQDCRLTVIEADLCEVAFDRPQRAVTPGQSVVFYAGEVCLGGGVIRARH